MNRAPCKRSGGNGVATRAPQKKEKTTAHDARSNVAILPRDRRGIKGRLAARRMIFSRAPLTPFGKADNMLIDGNK